MFVQIQKAQQKAQQKSNSGFNFLLEQIYSKSVDSIGLDVSLWNRILVSILQFKIENWPNHFTKCPPYKAFREMSWIEIEFYFIWTGIQFLVFLLDWWSRMKSGIPSLSLKSNFTFYSSIRNRKLTKSFQERPSL